MEYIEFRTEVNNNKSLRNTIIRPDELISYIEPLKDCYAGLFYYSEDILPHVAKHNTISGYHGKVGIHKLIIDFDAADLEIAKNGALRFIERLQIEYNVREEEIEICYSGKKGFAISILTQGLYGFDEVSENIPQYTKDVCFALGSDLEGFDITVYQHNRLFRLINTRHQKLVKLGGIETQLFKVQILLNNLKNWTIEEIQRYATKPRIAFMPQVISSPEKINQLLQNIQNNVNQRIEKAHKAPLNLINPTDIDKIEIPKNTKACIYLLEQGVYTEARDNALLIIASQDRQKGMQQEVIRAKLNGIVELMGRQDPQKSISDPITDSDLDRIVKQAFNNDYSHGCNHPILNMLCKDKCYLYRAKLNSSKVGTVNILEAYNQSTKFYTDYYSNLILTGIEEIDRALPMFKGTTNLLVGRPGSGKSSIILNIINNMAMLETPTILFSMDMSQEMMLGRLGSIVLAANAGQPQMSSLEFMMEHTKQVFNGDFKKAMEQLSKYVWISSQRGLTVKDMMAEIDIQEQNMGKKFRLCVIDHIQLIKSDKNNEFERHSSNAQLITEFAKTRNICVLGISHAVDTDYGVSAKGTRSWQEECSSELICYRPFQHLLTEHDHFMSLKPSKNRLGSLDSIDLYYDPPSGWSRKPTAEELVEIDKGKQELSEKKERKY